MTEPTRNPSASAGAAGPDPRTAAHTRVRAVPALVVALGFAFLPVSRWLDEFASVAHLVRYELVWWAVVALIVVWVLRVERRPLRSVGVRPLTGADAALAVAAAIVTLAGLVFLTEAVLPRLGLSEREPMHRLLATPAWWRCLSVLRAAVSEELLYRGYAIERLAELTRRRALAALVSGVAFTLAHVGTWGWGHLLIAGYGGAVLTLLYLWRRNLGTSMLAHAIVDGVAVFFG